MPRSARLTNIANGLCSSFVSRNNDVAGYWAIGKLRLLAGEHLQTTVSIDLLALSMQPSSFEFLPALVRYREMLARVAESSGITPGEVTAACITIYFAPPPWPRPRYAAAHQGEQFVMIVTIHADDRAAGIARRAGYCRPHDPARECRSTRASR